MSAEYPLPLLAKTDPAVTRSLCDSWATYLLLDQLGSAICVDGYRWQDYISIKHQLFGRCCRP